MRISVRDRDMVTVSGTTSGDCWLDGDLALLWKTWKMVREQRVDEAPQGGLVHPDLDVVERILRPVLRRQLDGGAMARQIVKSHACSWRKGGGRG